jgi:hypothetical protein
MEDPMIVEPTTDSVRDLAPPTRDDRSMLFLELAVAGLAIVACLVLTLAR